MISRVEEAFGVIPDVYYDLIARVIPGIMFYICLDYACSGTLNYDKTETFLEAVIGVVAFYVLGFVLDVFGDMVVGCFFEIIKRHNAIKRDNAIKRFVKKILGSHNAIKRFVKKILGSHNAIKRVIKKFPEMTKSQDRSLFVKLCAELVLLRSLMLASLIFFVFSVSTHIFKELPQSLSDKTPYIFFLLVLLILLFGHFNNCTVNRLHYHFLKKSSEDHTSHAP